MRDDDGVRSPNCKVKEVRSYIPVSRISSVDFVAVLTGNSRCRVD